MKPLKELLTTPENEQKLLEGSHVYGDGLTYEMWQQHRRFIADAIHHAGTILDIGCANGFLLRCLLEWSEHALIPYGVEPDEERLEACRQLFPEMTHHFSELPIQKLAQLSEQGLPPSFDFVYWNVWDDIDFSKEWHHECVRQAFEATSAGGRLVLGFYDAAPSAIEAKIVWLNNHFSLIAGRKDNLPHSEVIVWWNKPHEKHP